jgi:hypothetical protein
LKRYGEMVTNKLIAQDNYDVVSSNRIGQRTTSGQIAGTERRGLLLFRNAISRGDAGAG